MTRFLYGSLIATILILGGFFAITIYASQDETQMALPPPESEQLSSVPDIPEADPGDLRGPKPPQATELTREERRFARYDRNFDKIITRNEMLASRTKSFRKLDVDGNNLLTFEEWAVATSERFAEADGDNNGELTPKEFATTKRKPSNKPRCRC